MFLGVPLLKRVLPRSYYSDFKSTNIIIIDPSQSRPITLSDPLQFSIFRIFPFCFSSFWWYDIMTNDLVVVAFWWTRGGKSKNRNCLLSFSSSFFFFLLFTLSLAWLNPRIEDCWIVSTTASDFPSFEIPKRRISSISNGDSVGFFTFWTQKMMVQHINRCVWPWNPIQRRRVLFLYGYVLYHFVALLHDFLQW